MSQDETVDEAAEVGEQSVADEQRAVEDALIRAWRLDQATDWLEYERKCGRVWEWTRA
jgi:hypothetical protein